MKTGTSIITAERERHITKEGFTANHDANFENGELANAAAFYSLSPEMVSFINDHWGNDMALHLWPFDLERLKQTPENRIKQLAKAGALIAAEIDRLYQALKIFKIDHQGEISFVIAESATEALRVYRRKGKSER